MLSMNTTTEGFTCEFDSYNLAKDKYKVEIHESYKIKLSQMRAFKGKVACAESYVHDVETSVNGSSKDNGGSSGSTTCRIITTAFDSPSAFLDEFNIKPEDKTKIEIEISIDELPANASLNS